MSLLSLITKVTFSKLGCTYTTHITHSYSIRDKAEKEPFSTRLAILAAQLPPQYLSEVSAGLDIYESLRPELFNFVRDPNLLDVVQELVGPEITLSPIQHIRPHVGAGDRDELHKWHCDKTVTVPEVPHAHPLAGPVSHCRCMMVGPVVLFRSHIPH